jgi:chemotaxis protein CheY-P-specific phosphatase CheC
MEPNISQRTGFFKKAGPDLARRISDALLNLTRKNIKVEFIDIQTSGQNVVFIDIQEKCFGSYVHFKSPKPAFQGILIAVFPFSSAKTLTELSLKRYHVKTRDPKLELSAFKEIVNMLLLTYITGLANALHCALKTSPPRFLCQKHFELNRKTGGGLVSVGQIRMTGETGGVSPIKGRFIIVY